MTPETEKFIDELAKLLADATGYPKADLRDRLLARAEYVALPSSQASIAKAEAKRQRKAARLARQQGKQA